VHPALRHVAVGHQAACHRNELAEKPERAERARRGLD
jgi:hypothetical protein